MKILVISDVHHRPLWREMIDKQNPDKIIFIGDYFDNFHGESVIGIRNFEEILEYRDSSNLTKEKVILLTGNHDCHYIFRDQYEQYSGYRKDLADSAYKLLIGQTKMAHLESEYLFTHAGVSKVWCEHHHLHIGKDIADNINYLWENNKQAFKFGPNIGRNYSGYGDDTTQSPIWIRPNSLKKCAVDWNQIVGHTGVDTITKQDNLNNDKCVWLTDTQSSSTGDQSYLVIEDGTPITKYL
jgi:predicted MPP superfamily phosphohydrolase